MSLAPLAGFRAGALGAVDRGLDLQRVLAGLDQERVDAAGDEPGALHRQRVFELLIGDMSERRQARARPDRAEHETGPAVMRELGDRLARQFGGAAVELERLVGDAELAERDRRAAEAVGLDRVAAGREIDAVDFADEIGPALVEDLGAVLVPVEIALDIEVARLHLRAHRAIAQQHAVGEIVEKMGHRVLPYRMRRGVQLAALPRMRSCRCGRLRGANAEQMADRDDQVGAVERVEMEFVDAVRVQPPALLGGERGRDETARIRIIVEPLEMRRHPGRDRGAARRGHALQLREIGDRQDPRHDRHLDRRRRGRGRGSAGTHRHRKRTA